MLETIINVLAYGSLLFAATAAYLQLNKLWTRKHLPDVAESISIPGVLVESVPLFFFGIYFLFNGELLGIIDSIIWLISAVLMVMIGSGLWVSGQRRRGFWQLVRGAVSRERSEITSLARELFAPASAPKLVELLTLMASIDGEVDRRERELVKEFAREWNLDIDWSKADPAAAKNVRLMEAQGAFSEYLESAPPPAQVQHLLDILTLLMKADDNVAPEEQMIFDEISGQAQAYTSDAGKAPGYAVILVPQGEQQSDAISALLKGVEPRTYAGGLAYVAGTYYAGSYAEVVCEEYRALGFFTVVMDEQLAAAG